MSKFFMLAASSLFSLMTVQSIYSQEVENCFMQSHRAERSNFCSTNLGSTETLNEKLNGSTSSTSNGAVEAVSDLILGNPTVRQVTPPTNSTCFVGSLRIDDTNHCVNQR